jgi:DNA-binding LacI/PurR family transcriptional regulator
MESCSPYFSLIMRGIESVAHAEGHGITILSSESLTGLAKLDGVLGHARGAAFLDKLPLKMPRVSVMVPWEGAPSVTGDDYDGAYKATEHLLSLGHRRIGFLGFINAVLVQKRVSGYEMALRSANVRSAPEWLWDQRYPSTEELSRVDNMHRNIEFGRLNAREWLGGDWQKAGLTAVICQNDEFAIGFMQAAREVGLRVPEDLSVVGFDSTPLCDLCSPRLTSVYYPLEKIGAVAAKLLLRQIRGEAVEPYSVELPVKLDVRESTGPAPQK